eukprot:9322094-Pyramimonas_sp.AAC.1
MDVSSGGHYEDGDEIIRTRGPSEANKALLSIRDHCEAHKDRIPVGQRPKLLRSRTAAGRRVRRRGRRKR